MAQNNARLRAAEAGKALLPSTSYRLEVDSLLAVLLWSADDSFPLRNLWDNCASDILRCVIWRSVCEALQPFLWQGACGGKRCTATAHLHMPSLRACSVEASAAATACARMLQVLAWRRRVHSSPTQHFRRAHSG